MTGFASSWSAHSRRRLSLPTVQKPSYSPYAWRSSAGGIEHYTFPVEKSESVETIRQRAYGAEGHLVARTRAERRTVLVSAYEPRATLEGLSEVLSSPDVWLAEDDGYTAVDVVTEKSVLHRHGAVTCLEIEIRPKRKTGMPWN